MFVINLDKSFTPYGEGHAHDVSRQFPSGAEVNIQLDVQELPERVLITTRIRGSDDIMKLLLATDACKRLGATKITVLIPYLPYARQDRVVRKGEAFSLKVFASLINAQGYEEVQVFDPHSLVALALIDRIKVIDSNVFVAKVLEHKENYILVAPDAGASKKVHSIAEMLGYTDVVVQGNKTRSGKGSVASVEIGNHDFQGKDVYIIDDICDGGATFTTLAKVIKEHNPGTINLVVSHGIFSKGLDVLRSGGVDHIYTTDSFKNNDKDCSYLTEVALCTIL
jgi:ribose-phosphate pyrophosphokinase